jgi:hypothetical protein
MAVDITGRTFGRLTAIAREDGFSAIQVRVRHRKGSRFAEREVLKDPIVRLLAPD